MSEFKIKLKTPTLEAKVEKTGEVVATTPPISPEKTETNTDIPVPKIWVQETQESSEVTATIQRPKIQLGSIKADKQESTETKPTNVVPKKEETTAAPIIKQEEKTSDTHPNNNKQMFWNYQSSFEKRGKKFIDRIRNIQWAPKTRLGFLMFLIGLTSFVIGSLMIITPEKHGFAIYKANIQEIYNVYIHDTTPTSPLPQEVTPPSPVESTPETMPEINTTETQDTTINEEEKRKKVKDYILQNLKK